MTTKRTKRKYTKPAMQVYELKHRSMILCGSGTRGSRNPYGDPTEWDWE